MADSGFPREGTNPKRGGRGIKVLYGKNFLKTARKWRKLDRGASKNCLCSSATGYTNGGRSCFYNYYWPQRSCGQGNIFTPVCHSFCSQGGCCDMGQNDTIGKIELKPSIVLSSDNTNCKNNIQLFHQLFDELSVYRDYH